MFVRDVASWISNCVCVLNQAICFNVKVQKRNIVGLLVCTKNVVCHIYTMYVPDFMIFDDLA